MKAQHIIFPTFIACMALATSAQASVISKIKSWHPYVQVAYIPTFVNAKETTKAVVSQNANPNDQYILHSTAQANGFGLSGGVDFPLNLSRSWLSRIDFDLDYTNIKAFNVGGERTMTLLTPPVDFKYNFNYRIKMSMLLLDANIDLFDYKRLHFYAGAGVDYNWLKTSDYAETKQAGTYLQPSISYQTYKGTQWLYHLNVGVQTQLSKHFTATIKERFYPNVPVRTGTGSNGYEPINALKQKIVLNQISFAVNYYF